MIPTDYPDQIGGPDACTVAATCPDCGEGIPTGRPYEFLCAEDHDGSPCPDCQFLNGAAGMTILQRTLGAAASLAAGFLVTWAFGIAVAWGASVDFSALPLAAKPLAVMAVLGGAAGVMATAFFSVCSAVVFVTWEA